MTETAKSDYYYKKPKQKTIQLSDSVWRFLFPRSKKTREAAKEIWLMVKGEALNIHNRKDVMKQLGISKMQYTFILQKMKEIGMVQRKGRTYVKGRGLKIE